MNFLNSGRHWGAFLLAVFVGLLLVAQPLTAKFRYGIAFNHPANIRANDEGLYLARIQEVIDGYPTIGNAYLWEHKSKPPSPVFLGEWLLAQPLKIFGIGTVAGDVLYDFFLPAFAVLLTYTNFFLVTGRRWVSILGTAFLFFGLYPGEFARAWSPQFVFLFWLSQFLFIFSLIRGGDDVRQRTFLLFAAAANFGFLFYLYPYYWTFYLLFFVILVFLYALSGWRDSAGRILALALGGLAIAIPYFVMTVKAMQLPEYEETLRRISMIDTHVPSGIAIIVPGITLLGIAFFFFRAHYVRWDRPAVFFVSGVIAALGSVNQHLVTGKNFEFSSHYDMLSFFFFAFFAAYLFTRILRHEGRWWVIFRVVLVGATLATIIPNLFDSRRQFAMPPAIKIAAGRYTPILDWIDREVAQDEVIYADAAISGLVPVYTNANVFFAPAARLFFLSTDELIDRFLLAHYYENIDEDFIRLHERQIYGVQFINAAAHRSQENRARSLLGLPAKPDVSLPDEAVERVFRRRDEIRERGFDRELKKYRVDYVIWDTETLPGAAFDALGFLKKIQAVDSFTIYRVR